MTVLVPGSGAAAGFPYPHVYSRSQGARFCHDPARGSPGRQGHQKCPGTETGSRALAGHWPFLFPQGRGGQATGLGYLPGSRGAQGIRNASVCRKQGVMKRRVLLNPEIPAAPASPRACWECRVPAGSALPNQDLHFNLVCWAEWGVDTVTAEKLQPGATWGSPHMSPRVSAPS